MSRFLSSIPILSAFSGPGAEDRGSQNAAYRGAADLELACDGSFADARPEELPHLLCVQ